MASEGSRRRGERAGLTREAVIAAARRVVDRDGVEALSMRRLASEIGVMPNTLYSHVDSKMALIDALLDDVLGAVATPDPAQVDWQDGLQQLMRATRDVLIEHPALVGSFLARSGRGPNAVRLGEVTFALLARGGIEGTHAVEAFRALLIFTLGFVAFEAPRRAEPEPAARRAAALDTFAAPDRAPEFRAVADALAEHPDEDTLASGLRWLLKGIAADR